MQLKVKVKPGSRTDETSREPGGLFKIKIKAPAVEGKANKYLVEYLSKVLGIPKSKIALVKGETTQFKTLEIDAAEKEVMKKLQSYK